MADQSLIRGQAAVSGARAAKGMAFRTGLAESLQQNLTNVAQAYELREQKIRDGEAMANANLLSYDPNNNLPPKYQDLIRQKTEEANNKINEIGKDIGISNTAKNAAMTKIVREAENDIKGYVDYVNIEMDSMRIVKQIADPNIGKDIASTLNNEVIDIVNKVAGGNYKLDNNNNYIFEGDSKIYNKNEIKDLVDQYSNSIYDINAVKQAKFSLIEAAAKSKSIQEYNSGVDAKLRLYNPNNPKDQASLKKELATIYGYTAEQLQQIEKEGGDYVGALKEELYDIGKEFVPPPVFTKSFDPSSNQGRANRYVESAQTLEGLEGLLREALPGAWQRNGTIISFYAGKVDKDKQPIYDSQASDISTPEGVRAVLKLAATNEYNETNGSKIYDYIRGLHVKGISIPNNSNNIEITSPTELSTAEIETKRSRWIDSLSENEFDKKVTFSDSFTKAGTPTGKIRDEEVRKESFKEKYPNYPAEIYGQENIFGKGDTKALDKKNKKIEKRILNNKEEIIKVLRKNPKFEEKDEVLFRQIEGLGNFLDFLKNYNLADTSFADLNQS